MERSEAKEIIEALHLYDIQSYSWKKVREAIEVAIEALETQIPKTPYAIDGKNECPVCGCEDIEQLDVSGICEMPYCPCCGQKIDWSKDGDK